MSEVCEVLECDGESEYVDCTGYFICRECMEYRLESGDAEPCDFELID